MNLEEITTSLIEKLKDYTKDDSSGHNIDHLIRTYKYATYLQSIEGGDLAVIQVAALVHDVHRILQGKENHFVSPKDSLPVVKTFIEDLNLSDEQKEHILYAVEHHEEYAFGQNKVTVSDIESKILQDADNLDALGAMGICRAITYGIKYGEPEYDPNTPLYQNDYSEDKGDASMIHHLNNKLIRLGDYMNTATAKKLAKDKVEFIKDFIERYLDEYNSNI